MHKNVSHISPGTWLVLMSVYLYIKIEHTNTQFLLSSPFCAAGKEREMEGLILHTIR